MLFLMKFGLPHLRCTHRIGDKDEIFVRHLVVLDVYIDWQSTWLLVLMVGLELGVCNIVSGARVSLAFLWVSLGPEVI